ncbi:MAG TPA: tetratricopeptide repeat protein [Ramlibacter sp.]|nr:tetratricopeptide repeat protein [Ramlibacter sp.]
MLYRAAAISLSAILLASCASPAPSSPDTLPWLDAQFQYDPAIVKVTPEELFRLDGDLEGKLSQPAVRDVPVGLKLKRVIDTIFDKDRKGFAYRAGHSTAAADTWRNRTGDCLSLTVLTYSVARTLGMSPVMQEVQTPAVFGRAGEFDVVNQHVNVMFPRIRGDLMAESETHEVVIDFEPDFAAPRRGTPLTEAGILARYYNNVAVENMAQGNYTVSYAHFRAAIRADPSYISPYGNLAVLYRRAGRDEQAEQLLRYAIGLGGNTDVALHELHRFLKDHGRVREAGEVERKLEARLQSDPYHWIGLALADMEKGDTRRAIDKLERANEIAPSFAEIHRYLAVAYARAGKPDKAREELVVLQNLGGSMNKIALLRRKLDRLDTHAQ